jgi:nicotinate-nucleotide adenylyltransferase
MRVALFGGTFDPIHLGHLLIAEAAREQFHLDRVVFLPNGHPPHRSVPFVSARHRLAMVRLAVRGNPGFRVSDWEIRQNRVVYTIETLEHFRRRQPRVQWHFIVGADELRNLPLWKESRRLRRLCRFIGMDRLDPYASTDIRRRIRRGLSIRYRVPERVERYIRTHHLY